MSGVITLGISTVIFKVLNDAIVGLAIIMQYEAKGRVIKIVLKLVLRRVS